MNKSRFCTVIKLIINVSKKKGGLRHERGGEKIEGGGGAVGGLTFKELWKKSSLIQKPSAQNTLSLISMD